MLTILLIQSIDNVGAVRQESIRVCIVSYHLLRIPEIIPRLAILSQRHNARLVCLKNVLLTMVMSSQQYPPHKLRRSP